MIVGIDEAGRGPCAGPLVAVAVALERSIAGLADSKALTPSQRRKLAVLIKTHSAEIGIGWVSAAEIDRRGLSWAQTKAMTTAFEQIKTPAKQVILDGSYNYLSQISHSQAIVGADNHLPAVMAAGIIAKVSRDDFMISLAKLYPRYDFDKHKGYCTTRHLLLAARYGVVKGVHRLSYQPLVKLPQTN